MVTSATLEIAQYHRRSAVEVMNDVIRVLDASGPMEVHDLLVAFEADRCMYCQVYSEYLSPYVYLRMLTSCTEAGGNAFTIDELESISLCIDLIDDPSVSLVRHRLHQFVRSGRVLIEQLRMARRECNGKTQELAGRVMCKWTLLFMTVILNVEFRSLRMDGDVMDASRRLCEEIIQIAIESARFEYLLDFMLTCSICECEISSQQVLGMAHEIETAIAKKHSVEVCVFVLKHIKRGDESSGQLLDVITCLRRESRSQQCSDMLDLVLMKMGI